VFWMRKKESKKLRFQHYVPITLAMNIPKVLEKKAKEKHAEVYRDLMRNLGSETFIIASMIGICRPDIMPGIFRQNDSNYEQLMETTRDGLTKIVALREQKGEINLNDLASMFLKPEIEILPKGNLAQGLTTEVVDSLGAIFLFGYTFGHDYPQLYLEMLKKRIQEANKTGPNTFFTMGMLSVYSAFIEDDELSSLLNTNGLNEIRLSYDDGTVSQKWISIYQRIASELVRNYELAAGPLT
jgi:hypothetical protein